MIARRTEIIPDLSGLRGEVRAIKAWLNGDGQPLGPGRDLVREAIEQFRATKALSSLRQTRLVASGLVLATGGRPALIEDSEYFPALLEGVMAVRNQPRPFRRCWRGLLDGYFNYDPIASEAGGRGWEALREFLDGTKTYLRCEGFQPDWVLEIDNHANLLSKDPCSRYGPDLLAGKRDAIEKTMLALGVSDASWVNRRLVEAQISAVVALKDRPFKERLPSSLELLEAHDLIADDGLAKLLNRYVDCESLEVSPKMRDYSVVRWGNPWISSNARKWSRVGKSARDLINGWLKLDFIEKFFSLLSEDKLNDARRLAFWKRYHDKIDDMRFALGDTAARNPSPDFRDLRRRMTGLSMDLLNGGRPNNNAFIMRIGQRIFVEFGEKGNALYIFDGVNLPFDLTRRYISGNSTALKHADHLERIIHKDSTWQTWEQKVAAAIEQHTGVRPNDTAGLGLRKASSARPASGTGNIPKRPAAATGAGGTDSSLSDDLDLGSFLRKYGLKSVDSRDKGGSLWVYADKSNGPVGTWLKGHGFAWSLKRAAWYLASKA